MAGLFVFPLGPASLACPSKLRCSIEVFQVGGAVMTDVLVRAPAARKLTAAKAALGQGWIVYADWTSAAAGPVSRFSATWTVPQPPQTPSGQTLFLFSAMQNASMMAEAVLQWGVSAAGGGPYWSAACWYVDKAGGAVRHSELVPVKPGDVLTAVMTLTGPAPSGFAYACEFRGLPATALAIPDAAPFSGFALVLEAVNLKLATDYPSSQPTIFRAIEAETGTAHPALDWTAVNAVTDTGQRAIVVSNANPGSQIEVYYRNDAPWEFWGTADIGQSSGAVGWLMGDINGDRRDEAVQLWNDAGKLAIVVYAWNGNALATLWSGTTAEGSSAVAWQIGDINGDGKDEIVQLWNNASALGVLVYGWSGNAVAELWGSSNVGQGAGAVAWLTGDVNGDGKDEIVQLWNNNGRLAIIVYGWMTDALTTIWQGPTTEGAGAVDWQIGDINGDGKAEIVQLWNNAGRLGVLVYGWVNGGIAELWGTSDVGQGSGAVGWLIGDVNGDGRQEITQLWNNAGKLGTIVYGWSGNAMTTIASGTMAAGSGAVAWQSGDLEGDGRDEIVQLWNNDGKLGIFVYGWSVDGPTPYQGTDDAGEGSGAIAWMTGRFRGPDQADILQFWNNAGKLGALMYNPNTVSRIGFPRITVR